MDNSISLKSLIELMKNNYLYNIYYQGISELVKMYPTKKDFFNYEFKISKVEIQKTKFENDDFVEIELIYPEKGGKIWMSNGLTIGKHNDVFFILTSNFSLEEQQKILNKIDFSNLYNYFMTHDIFDYQKLKGIYRNNEENMQLDVVLNLDSIIIGDEFKYCLKHKMLLDKLVEIENSLHMDNYKIKMLKATDSNFLENVRFEYDKLPENIKNLIDNNYLNMNIEDKIKTYKKKSFIKRWINR